MGNLHSSLLCCCPKPKHFIIKEGEYNKKDSYEEIMIKNKEILRGRSTIDRVMIKPGTTVFRKESDPELVYKDIKLIGEGSYGKVIMASNILTGSIRAVKIIEKSYLKEEYGNNEIENEIKILKSLDHPNIYKVYEYFDYDNSLYIVNEYIGGGDLFSLITKENYLKEPISLMILYQLLSAVAYIHIENIFHGDIKPENIMIDLFEDIKLTKNTNNSDLFQFHIKLIDFGTSKMVKKVKVFKNLVGTSNYVAPEVILGGYYKQCDLWSCGVLLYIMLSGCFPFGGDTDEEVFENIKNESPSYDLKIFESISNETIDLMKKLLEKDPYERISAIKAIEHDAFKPIIKLKKEEDSKILKNRHTSTIMKKMKKPKTLKFNQAVTAFLSHNFLSKEMRIKYENIFKAIDKNNDGRVSREELKEGFIQSGINFTQEEIDLIINNIDIDNSGYIECEEFISASADLNILLSEGNIKFAFDSIDLDKSGHISVDEIGKFIFGEENITDKELIKRIITQLGKDCEKDMTFDDFRDIMNSLKESNFESS